MSLNKYVSLDTNILLLDSNNIYTIASTYENRTILLPETVIDEIDSKKTALGSLGYHARSFGRLMAKTELINVTEHKDMKIAHHKLGDILIDIVACKSYPNFNGLPSSVVNDQKIIYVASQFEDNIFISNDTMCRVRAGFVNLPTADFKYIESVNIEFSKDFVLPEAHMFNALQHKPIIDIDPDYAPEIFSYKFTCPESSQAKLAIIQNGLIQIIGKDTEKKLREQEIVPVNSGQLILSSLIQDQTADITLCESLAGSGKTLSAFSNAMKLVRTNSPYESIIYIRNSVDDVASMDEEIGFLSGNDEKMQVYLQPFYDTVDTIVRRKVSKKHKGVELETRVQEAIDETIAKYNMSPMIALGLRGRTFDNSVVIIDEAQNMSKATMQKILSRVGKDCKVVVLGSNRQIDSKFLTKYTNGLSVLLDATRRTDLPIKLNATTLTKVVRGPITAFSELIFSP